MTRIPVSYTHLDVYKRQALGCIGYNIYEDTLAAVCIPVGVGLVVAVVTPVSYTHLQLREWEVDTFLVEYGVNLLVHIKINAPVRCV